MEHYPSVVQDPLWRLPLSTQCEFAAAVRRRARAIVAAAATTHHGPLADELLFQQQRLLACQLHDIMLAQKLQGKT